MALFQTQRRRRGAHPAASIVGSLCVCFYACIIQCNQSQGSVLHPKRLHQPLPDPGSPPQPERLGLRERICARPALGNPTRAGASTFMLLLPSSALQPSLPGSYAHNSWRSAKRLMAPTAACPHVLLLLCVNKEFAQCQDCRTSSHDSPSKKASSARLTGLAASPRVYFLLSSASVFVLLLPV